MLTLSKIQAARERIAPYIVRTPMKRSRTLSDELGTNVHIKMELFQKTGSFKPRGSFAQMLALDEEQKARGVVAWSGGNFAQGVAFAAYTLEVDALIVMPETTPQNYLDATRGYGAKIELAKDIAAASTRMEELASEGRAKLHPYDSPHMVAGNGSLALEVLEDLPDLTDIFVSIGGGGLIESAITVVQALKPDVRIWGVETELAATMHESLKAGKVIQYTPSSLARTLSAPYVSASALAACQEQLHELILVSDEEAYRAQRFLLERLKQLTELAASCTWAAAQKVKEQFTPESQVCLVLCGGNVSLDDLALYREMFEKK